MGVDIVSVGLRHKVRVDKPLHLIEDVSKIYNANIHIVYYNDKRKDCRVPLFDMKVENADENLTIEIPVCQYLQQKTSPFAKLIEIDWESEIFIKQLRNRLYNDFGRYEIRGFKNEDTYEITIYRENAEIFISSPFRWYGFIGKFNQEEKYQYPEDSLSLDDFRKELYIQSKLLGCNEVIYFADQGQGEMIYDTIYKPANELLHYIKNREFYEVIDKAIKKSKAEGRHQFSHYDEDWALDTEMKSIFIDIPDFLMNHREPISTDLSIDVLFDDFRDLKQACNNG